MRKLGERRAGLYGRNGARKQRLRMTPEQRKARDSQLTKDYRRRVRVAQEFGPRIPGKMTINLARLDLLADPAPTKSWG